MTKIGLRETLNALRTELSESILRSEGKQLRFEVGEIELEFQIAIEQTHEGKGGIHFWVMELGGGAAEKNATVHRVKIPLTPVWNDDRSKGRKSPVLTGSSGDYYSNDEEIG